MKKSIMISTVIPLLVVLCGVAFVSGPMVFADEPTESQIKLMTALGRRDLETLKSLVATEPDIFKKPIKIYRPSDEVLTAAYFLADYDVIEHEEAARQKNREILEFLLANGQDIHTRGKEGKTLLHLAASRNACDMIDVFIEHGIDIDVRDKRQKTPLHHAMAQNRIEATRLLIELGADPSLKAGSLGSAMDDNPKPAFLEAVKLLHERVLSGEETRIDLDFIISCFNPWGEQPGYFEAIQSLIEDGADPNAKGRNGDTVLFSAIRSNDCDCIEFLLQHGGDLTMQNDRNETPLLVAAMVSTPEVVRLLVERGADLLGPDSVRATPLEIAGANPDSNVIRYLISQEAPCRKSHPLQYALQSNVVSHEMVQFLLDETADLLSPKMIRELPANYAISPNVKLETLQLLLDRGLHLEHPKYRTALMAAVSVPNDRLEVVRFLVENGANVNAANGGGATVLHLAIDRPKDAKLEIVQYLLENGADHSARRTRNLQTPLHVACQMDSLKTVQCLVEAGADVNQPIDVARSAAAKETLHAVMLEQKEKLP